MSTILLPTRKSTKTEITKLTTLYNKIQTNMRVVDTSFNICNSLLGNRELFIESDLSNDEIFDSEISTINKILPKIEYFLEDYKNRIEEVKSLKRLGKYDKIKLETLITYPQIVERFLAQSKEELDYLDKNS
jgi:hypothetical protein